MSVAPRTQRDAIRDLLCQPASNFDQQPACNIDQVLRGYLRFLNR
jgi:hypothetical protein